MAVTDADLFAAAEAVRACVAVPALAGRRDRQPNLIRDAHTLDAL